MIEAVHDFRSIIQNPVDAYAAMRQRLQHYGPNAPFPEFQPAVAYIADQLAMPRYQAVLAKHPDLAFEQREVDTQLAHVNLTFDFDDRASYPYDKPFEAPYPYRPTIDAIESGLRLLDKYSRLEPGSKAVPLYHFDRYAYHRHALIADPDVVLMPTPEI